MTTTTYIATRDSARPTLSDEDRAMTYVKIASGTDLSAVQDALKSYMTQEVSWLRSRTYARELGNKRADEISAAIGVAGALIPGIGKRSSQVSVECAGLRFAITAVTR